MAAGSNKTTGVLRTARAESDVLGEVMRAVACAGETLRILEAGCGRRWNIDMSDLPYHLTGVDLDADALQARQQDYGDLDEHIVGDLRTVELPDESFDIVYCAYVLEHVAGAEAVLERFLRALRPGGLLIVAIPDGRSVFGFVTTHTPHWIHVAFKRYVHGMRNAGKPGFGPYPTVYDPVISSRGMRAFGHSHGMTMRLEYRTAYYLNVFGRFAPLVKRLLRLIAALSFGRLTATHNNVGFVLEKPAAVQESGRLAESA